MIHNLRTFVAFPFDVIRVQFIDISCCIQASMIHSLRTLVAFPVNGIRGRFVESFLRNRSQPCYQPLRSEPQNAPWFAIALLNGECLRPIKPCGSAIKTQPRNVKRRLSAVLPF